MDTMDKRRLDYEQTTAYFHALAEIRFKLLAFLPLAAGGALFVVGNDVPPELVIAIGILGFIASLGLTFYDQRNTELYDRMQRRAKVLEAELEFDRFFDERDLKEGKVADKDLKKVGGAFLDRPRRGRKFCGIPMWHDLGLTLVYAVTLAGWTFLTGHGIVRLIVPAGPPREEYYEYYAIASGVALFMGALVYGALILHDDPTDEQSSLPVRLREQVWVNLSEPRRKTRCFRHSFGVIGFGVGIAPGLWVWTLYHSLLIPIATTVISLALGLVIGHYKETRHATS